MADSSKGVAKSSWIGALLKHCIHWVFYSVVTIWIAVMAILYGLTCSLLSARLLYGYF